MSAFFLVRSSTATSAVTIVAATARQALQTYDDMVTERKRRVVTYDESGAELSRERLLELVDDPPGDDDADLT